LGGSIEITEADQGGKKIRWRADIGIDIIVWYIGMGISMNAVEKLSYGTSIVLFIPPVSFESHA
jgi:hypothetical protein